MHNHDVIPAQAGIQRGTDHARRLSSKTWIPAFAGMTRWVTGAVLAVLVAALPAAAAETINSFVSDVELNADGSVDVTEVIEVNVEGNEIRRGIYRDIPTLQINDDNSRLRANLEVVEVRRDGRPEPYSLESPGGGFVRIRIGDADVWLDYGPTRYTIRYTMTRMARFFADHDELYWNATGNYWNFPILSAVTNIRLPAGAVIGDLAGYTGRVGSTEEAVTITRTADNAATFRATRTLAPGEGMTIAAMFQKGVIAEPSEWQRLVWWLSDNRDLILPLIAVGIILLYYFLAWSGVGRDPARGTIIPLFHPPKGFSPALVHYIHRMGWENSGWTAFTASIFDLGVKGLVKIDNVKKTLKVTVTGKEPGEPLPPGEALVFSYLRSKGTVVVNTTNGPKINEVRGDFIKALEAENREVFFRNNTGYVLGGVALSIAVLGALVLLDVIPFVSLILAVVAGFALGLFTGLFNRFWKSGLAGRFIFFVWGAIILINFGSGLASFLDDIRLDTSLLAAASVAALNIVFAILMRAPTVQGRKIMDQIEGFKMYLETAEERRLNMENVPPMTIERFERILPYAIALKVEKPWSDHFDAELKRNAVSDATGTTYHPSWYHGSDWSSGKGGFSNTVAAASSGMAAAMIAAQPVSSSSSGFSGGGGGGGSSGGGGGGGGGGGW
jgi:uncharacterized membrane protein YgcG